MGKDVADALGYSNASKAIIAHVDSEDKVIKMLPNSQNGKTIGKAYIINESGLYSLILSSKLESAKRFKHWVTSEVLPALRKTGGYISSTKMIVEILNILAAILKSGICSFFDLVIRPIIRFYFSDGQTLVLTLSIPLQIKYVLTGQLYMQVPVKI